ncbi:MAG TPA: DUF4159 domain-containing protein [Vicinamibacterales bacterium]|nr:DUF4159 domain-containing protein [Vicinamibacterales bacterium]
MQFARRRLAWTLVGILVVIGAGVGVAHAQRIWAGGYRRTPPRFPTATTFDGGFHFCRVLFQSDRREKQGWRTDYPGADLNFSVRLAELTKVRVTMAREGGQPFPDAVVVRLTDDDLFQCPFIFMEDAGTARFTEIEAGRLRDYLLKGGFLLASDYHGSWAQEQLDEELRKILPPGQYPIVDLTPPGHPMWNTMFPVTRLPQMASIMTWRRTGGGTIERWNDDAGPPTARGIADAKGRVMVVMVHNTDLPDPWEREGEDPDYFFRFSPEAYAVGLDILLYAMTH